LPLHYLLPSFGGAASRRSARLGALPRTGEWRPVEGAVREPLGAGPAQRFTADAHGGRACHARLALVRITASRAIRIDQFTHEASPVRVGGVDRSVPAPPRTTSWRTGTGRG